MCSPDTAEGTMETLCFFRNTGSFLRGNVPGKNNACEFAFPDTGNSAEGRVFLHWKST